MSQPCFYHSTSASVRTCMQCGVPICQDCIQKAGGLAACQNCANTVRARFATNPPPSAPTQGQQPNYSQPSQQPGYGQQQGYGSQPGYGQQPRYGARVSTNSGDGRAMMLGILASLAISIIGSILIMKILFYSHFGLSLLYIALGYGVGYGLHRFTGTGGGAMPGIACLIMLAGLAVGHLVYVNDVLHTLGADAGAVSFTAAIPVVMQSFSFMHWICIAIGVAACWRGVESQGS